MNLPFAEALRRLKKKDRSRRPPEEKAPGPPKTNGAHRAARLFAAFLLLGGLIHFNEYAEHPLLPSPILYLMVFAVYAALILCWLQSLRERLMRSALTRAVSLDEDTRLFGKRLTAGCAFWTVSDRELHRLNERLADANEIIGLENELIRYEREQAEEKARIDAGNAAYGKAENSLRPVQRKIEALLEQARPDTPEGRRYMARVQVHDRLGHLLLMGRAFLADPDHRDGEELIRTMKELGSVLRADVTKRTPAADLFTETQERVKRLGVKLEILGEAPPAGPVRDLLARALGECAVNAVKHAGGDRVRLRIASDGAFCTAVHESNGEMPREPIQELGGLLSLRRMAKGMGGFMAVTADSSFRLTLRLPAGD